MKLRPALAAPDPGYPSLGKRLARGLLMAATVTATSLGGCGPPVHRGVVDQTIDRGDLDAAVTSPTGPAEPAPAPGPATPAPGTQAPAR